MIAFLLMIMINNYCITKLHVLSLGKFPNRTGKPRVFLLLVLRMFAGSIWRVETEENRNNFLRLNYADVLGHFWKVSSKS